MTTDSARTVYLPDIKLTVTIDSPSVERLPDETAHAAFSRARRLVTENTFGMICEAASISAIDVGINHESLSLNVEEAPAT